MFLHRRWKILLVLLLAAAGCRSAGPESFGPIERLNTSAGTLGTFTFPYYSAITTLQGGGALAIWMNQERGFRPLVYRRAAAASASFGDEQYISPESMRETISIIPEIQRGPRPDELYAVWQARRPVSGDKLVVFRRSDDGGVTWGEERRINAEPTSFIPSLATDPDGAIYAAWVDERRDGFRVFFNRSLDHGDTWLPEDVQLDSSDVRHSSVTSVSTASDGTGRVLVVWEESTGGGRRIHAVSSSDRGTTWGEPVFVDDGKRMPAPSAPRVVFAGGRAIVVWTAAASGSSVIGQVWSDVSSDGGVTWGEDVLVHEMQNGLAPRVHLVAEGGKARLVFHAGPLQKHWQIYYTETTPDGRWRAVGGDIPAVSTGEGRFANPRLVVVGQSLFVTYEDLERRIMLSRSTDDGNTWTTTSEPVYDIEREHGADALGKTIVHYPQVAADGDVAYVMWEVWTDAALTVKTLADAQTKTRPADLYVRRVTFRR